MYTIDQTGYINAHNAAVSQEMRQARIGGRRTSTRPGTLDRLSRVVADLLRTGSSETAVVSTQQATN
jgi:hypothetical protein